MQSIEHVGNFGKKALSTIRDLAEVAESLDIILVSLSFREWLDLKYSLLPVVHHGGRIRVTVGRDDRQTTPEVIEQILKLDKAQVAFDANDKPVLGRRFLFHSNNTLQMLITPVNGKGVDLNSNGNENAIIRYDDIDHEEAARKAIDEFEERWRNATLVNDRVLADFKAVAFTSAFAEGDLVRSTTELYREYGVGRIQKLKGPLAKTEFNPSVFMQPPYRSENKILDLAEIERVDTPLERASQHRWDEPWRFELKMQAARFLTGNKGGQLSNARTEILPHQIFTAFRVISSPRRRFLLADEVGLGKTIEAGMIWQALAQRGQAKRTLIITPAGLTTQWQEEMQDKFDTTFEIFQRDFLAVNPRIWDYKARAIASIDTLKRPVHKQYLLENRKWDLIIFDEAHKLSAMDYGSGKVEKTQNYRLAEELRHQHYCDALLLLTATPHQGEENHSRFKNLLLLLGDDIDFTGLEDRTLFSGQGNSFTDYVIRTPKKDVTDAQGHKVFKGRQTHRLPFKMYADEARFYKAVAEYIRDGYKMLDRFNDPTHQRAAGFVLTTFQKLNASSTAAIRSALEKRLARLRGELENLPDKLEEEDELYFDERYEGEREEQKVFFEDREVIEDEVGRLESLLSLRIKHDRKLDELIKLVDHIALESPRRDEEKVLIFTEYRQTQCRIVKELEDKYGKGSVVVIHGGIKLERREEQELDIETVWAPFSTEGALGATTTKRTSQRLFRDHPKVRFLVSTEAGGEGINLQFCHICVNYDLPWNPMRVEQRVGRVYRYGQDKVVQVYHFFNQGTIEDRVQSFFEDRLDRAATAISQITGESAEDIKGSLNGQLESEIDPANIYKRALVEGDLNKQTQKEIAEAVERAKHAYEIATQSLFRDVSSYSFDNYRRELASDLTLSDLRVFSERFLSKHRRQLQQRDSFVEFIVPDVLKPYGLPERYRAATFDRGVAIKRTDAEFLALGHQFVDSMLEYVGSYDFGGLTAIRRIKSPELSGLSGFLFLFVIRQRITREDSDECLFQFAPVFVTADGQIHEEASHHAVNEAAIEWPNPDDSIPDPDSAFEIAKGYIEDKAGLWDWNDDVEFLGLSWVEFG